MKQCMHLKYGNVSASHFDKKQIAMGQKVEREHTNDMCLVNQILRAHLMENPRYYTYLDKMEKQMNKDKRIKK